MALLQVSVVVVLVSTAIVVVHAIANNLDKVELSEKGLNEFIQVTKHVTPLERGWISIVLVLHFDVSSVGERLGLHESIISAHEVSSNQGQTVCIGFPFFYSLIVVLIVV